VAKPVCDDGWGKGAPNFLQLSRTSIFQRHGCGAHAGKVKSKPKELTQNVPRGTFLGIQDTLKKKPCRM
jgi:hypothetical protein